MEVEREVVYRKSFEEDSFPNTVFLPRFWKSYHWIFIPFDEVLPSRGSSLGVSVCRENGECTVCL